MNLSKWQDSPGVSPSHQAPSLEQVLFLHLLRAQERLGFELASLLKQKGLSLPQYILLRILRGAGKGGLSCQELSGRMIAHLPDITRLLDRLDERGLLARERGESADRRRVINRLTAAGAERLAALDAPVAALQRRQFGALSRQEQVQLRALLVRLHRAGQGRA